MHLLTAVQHRPYGRAMSPISARARMHRHPVSTGRMPARAGGTAPTSLTTITTGTGTTGNGWTFVCE